MAMVSKLVFTLWMGMTAEREGKLKTKKDLQANSVER